MTKAELNTITSWLVENVFRNSEIMFSEEEIKVGDEVVGLPDVIATLHNLLYEQVTGERYDYMFHWANKVGSWCVDDIFDNMLEGAKELSRYVNISEPMKGEKENE